MMKMKSISHQTASGLGGFDVSQPKLIPTELSIKYKSGYRRKFKTTFAYWIDTKSRKGFLALTEMADKDTMTYKFLELRRSYVSKNYMAR
jgi:hypothetical protein